MSSPQPPDGGQQGQQPRGSGDPNANAANTPDPGADSTHMISSRMAPQESGDQSSGSGGDSTQVVRPATPPQQGGQAGGDSTAVVPPSMQPPQPMYEQPGLSGQNQPNQPPQPPQTGGHPQQPPQTGGHPQQPPQPGAPGGGFQPPQPQGGFGAPPPQAGQPQPGQPGQPQPGQPQPGQPFPGQPPQAGPQAQPGFGGPPPGFPPGGAPVGQSVEWSSRVVPFLLDYIAPMIIPELLIMIGGSNLSMGMVGTGYALMVVAGIYSIWNLGYRQGTTGQSLGKTVGKTKLVSEDTGQPLGFGQAFLRQLVHILDALPCYVGFLSPLWDEKNQTWADKIMRTAVVPAEPQGPQPPQGPPSGGFAQPGQPPQGPAYGQPGQPPQGPAPGGYGQRPQQPPQW